MIKTPPIAFKEPPRNLVLYILGWGRSGSSICANILGSLPGCASLGEVRYLWDRGILHNGICGCGEAFSECSFWPGLQAGGQPLTDLTEDHARQLTRLIGSGGRPRQIPALQSARLRDKYFESNKADLALQMDVYTSAFERSGSRVLIDASKSPFYALNFLKPDMPFDVAFLHLVRDPRAVLHSWKKTKKREDGAKDQLFPRYSSVRSLLQWAIVNSRCERFARLAPERYFLIRYEDFAQDWRQTLLTQTDGLFEAQETDASVAQRTATVHAQHSISGNPSRFDTGEVTLKPDNSWTEAITRLDRQQAALICGRVAGRYGYSV